MLCIGTCCFDLNGARVCSAVLSVLGGLLLPGPANADDPEAGTLRGHGGPVKSVSVSSNGNSVLTGSFDYSAAIWDAPGEVAPKLVLRLWEHDGAVNSAQFVPGTKRVITASDDGKVALWDMQTGNLVKRFEGHSHKVVSIAVSGDGKVAASAAWDRTVRLWNLETLEAGPVLKGHRNSVNSVVLSSDGRVVFSAGYNGEIRQWDTTSGLLHRVLYKHGWGINVIALLAGEGALLFGSLNGEVGVLDITSGEVIKQLGSHERPVLSVATALEHGQVATGGGDGLIQVWDTRNWKVKYRHKHNYGPVWALDFSGDGKSMYFAGLDDHVALLQMEPDRPFAVAQSKLPRSFQQSEGLGPGELQFARKCSVCHSLGEDHKNRAGPSLIGVFGRRAGSLADYKYSSTLRNSKIVWGAHTIEQLFAEGPENFVPGSKMPLQKMSRREERLALIEYLKRATKVAPGNTQSGG